MKFILHIGRHKTGTSALQLFLANNRDVLRNYGINYPQFENRRTHHDLAFQIRDMEFDVALGKVAMAADGCDKVIISSEAFSKLKDPSDTAKVIPVGETKVVLYVREYASLLASWYQQNIQSSSRTCGFSDYISVQNVSHVPVIERWAKVYGKENVEVRLYDRENLMGGI